MADDDIEYPCWGPCDNSTTGVTDDGECPDCGTVLVCARQGCDRARGGVMTAWCYDHDTDDTDDDE